MLVGADVVRLDFPLAIRSQNSLVWSDRARHGRETLGFFAVAADRTDIGEALMDLDQTAAAPGGGWIVTKQAKILGFLGTHRLSSDR